jgi:hypothetical protein
MKLRWSRVVALLVAPWLCLGAVVAGRLSSDTAPAAPVPSPAATSAPARVGPALVPAAPARPAPSAPARLLPISRELEKCLDRTPRSPDFHTLPVLPTLDGKGELDVVWRLTAGPNAPPDPRGGEMPTLDVHLDLDGLGAAHSIPLGTHPGRLYARELSVCEGAPRSHGPCSSIGRPAPMQGVVSELSVQDWTAYVHRKSVFWMLLRTRSSIVLLTATGPLVLNELDRGLCTPDLWRRILETPVAPAVVTREQVLVGDPATELDCVRADMDGRCTG